jgi:hypothetical protein
MKGTVEIDGHDSAPLRAFSSHGLGHPTGHHARRDHKNVGRRQTSELLRGSVHSVEITHIGMHSDSIDSVLFQFRCGRLRTLLVKAKKNDGGTSESQLAGSGKANPTRATSNESHFAVYIDFRFYLDHVASVPPDGTSRIRNQ